MANVQPENNPPVKNKDYRPQDRKKNKRPLKKKKEKKRAVKHVTEKLTPLAAWLARIRKEREE